MFEYASIYRKADFGLVANAPILAYNLALEPYGKARSTMTIAGTFNLQDELIVCSEKYAWVLDSCVPTPYADTTSLGMLPLFRLFDRSIQYVAQASTVLQILNDLYYQFKSNADSLFAFSWLDVSGGYDESVTISPTVDDTGRYNMADYLDKVAASVIVDPHWTTDGIALTVIKRTDYTLEPKLVYYDVGSGNDELTRAVYKRDLISRITYHNTDTGAETDYYLLVDGTVTTNAAAANRVRGRWIIYSSSDPDIGLITAQFTRSQLSHSLELLTHQAPPLYYGPCKVRLADNELLESRVTSIGIRSTDDRYIIKVGKAATTLIEIIQELQHG